MGAAPLLDGHRRRMGSGREDAAAAPKDGLQSRPRRTWPRLVVLSLCGRYGLRRSADRSPRHLSGGVEGSLFSGDDPMRPDWLKRHQPPWTLPPYLRQKVIGLLADG